MDPQKDFVPEPLKLGNADQHAILIGGACRDRTGDLPLAKRALSQLS
jgi:hypothetical protein